VVGAVPERVLALREVLLVVVMSAGADGPRLQIDSSVVVPAPRYRRSMPRISTFYGVVIYMYWNERDHPVAHFHAYHAGRRASVAVDGTILAGSLEPRALQFVREWARLRSEEIQTNWDRARKSEPLLNIEPLP
jgi:Domain of unknown function (DUF4160)